jgi:transposase
MELHALFQAALGLVPPWQVVGVEFKELEDARVRGQLTIKLDFPPGSRFGCPGCGVLCPVHDTTEKSWRHLDFFQHVAFHQARVPRTSCPEHGALKVAVPWAREGSGFTLLFEAYVMLMVPQTTMSALARAVGEHDTRLWRLVEAHVEEARTRVDMSEVEEIVVDETSRAKRHTSRSSPTPARNERGCSSWPMERATIPSTTSCRISRPTAGSPKQSATCAWT